MTYDKFTETFKNLLMCSVCVCEAVLLSSPCSNPLQIPHKPRKNTRLASVELEPMAEKQRYRTFRSEHAKSRSKNLKWKSADLVPGLPASLNYIQRM